MSKENNNPMPVGRNIGVVQRNRHNYSNEGRRNYTHHVPSDNAMHRQSSMSPYFREMQSSMNRPYFNQSQSYMHPGPQMNVNTNRPPLPIMPANAFNFYPSIPFPNSLQGGVMNSSPIIHSAEGVPHVVIPVPVPIGPDMPVPPQLGYPAFVAQSSSDVRRESTNNGSEMLNYFLRRENDRDGRGRSPYRSSRRSERSRSFDSASDSWQSGSSRSKSQDRSYYKKSTRSPQRHSDTHKRRYSRSPLYSRHSKYRFKCRSRSHSRNRNISDQMKFRRSRSRSRERYNHSHSRSIHRDGRSERRSSECGDRDFGTDSRHASTKLDREMDSDYLRNSSYDKRGNEHVFKEGTKRDEFDSYRYRKRAERRESNSVDRSHGYRESREHRNLDDSNRRNTNYHSRKRSADKRTLSPVSIGDFSSERGSKYRRDCSPVSDQNSSSGSGELKIHISERGRWIESNRELSPVSDTDYCVNKTSERRKNDGTILMEDGLEIRRQQRVRLIEDGKEVFDLIDSEKINSRRMVDDHVIVADLTLDQSLNVDTELVSDSESLINTPYEELRVHATNLSPVSLKETEDFSMSIHKDDSFNGGRDTLIKSKSHRAYDSCSRPEKDKTGMNRNLCSNVGNKGYDNLSDNAFSVGDQKEREDDMLESLKVPDLCPYYSHGEGCKGKLCGKLHVCEHFIRGQCKYGYRCKKNHNFLTGQPYTLLCSLNNDIKKCKRVDDFIFDQILGRLCADAHLRSRVSARDERKNYDTNSQKDDSSSSVKKFDPSFDARMYARKHDGSDSYLRESSDQSSNRDEEALSLVSVEDVDNWEKYDRYETISESGMSENDAMNESKGDLENVSSNSSNTDMNMPIMLNKVAVPIGMNDPLVFTKPANTCTQATLHGSLNDRQLSTGTEDAALFPVMHVPPPQSGVKNHLPSPELLQKVIQSLPLYQFQSQPVEQNDGASNINVTQSGDSQLSASVTDTRIKCATTKDDKDPELKESIKTIWTFPHKGILNMSIIEFVTETEAYKEEFVAEIVRLLLTLDLPYVTMKKMIILIRENISINIKSTTDLRKILEMYPDNFQIIETVDSDDEEDDVDVRKNVQIKAKINIGFCEKHGYLPFAVGKCDCHSLHICRFYFLSNCGNNLCKFGHKLKTEHNLDVLKQLKLHRMTGEEIISYVQDIDNRTIYTIPGICRFYNRSNGCYKGDNVDNSDICHNLHMCFHKVKGICSLRNCTKSHSIRDKQPLSLLQKYGLDPDENGDEKIIQLLSEKALQMDKEKERKNAPYEPSKSDLKVIIDGSKVSAGEQESVKQTEDKKQPKKSPSSGTLPKQVKSKYKMVNASPAHSNPQVPVVCRFYNNELGCKKKDWGPEGFCYFLHVCQFYITGDCKFGYKCKRSHDLVSGQAALLLQKYDIDTNFLSVEEILKLLNNTTGVSVQIPDKSTKIVKVKSNKKTGNSSELDREIKIEIGNEHVKKSTNADKEKLNEGSDIPFRSCNVEDVIKHILEKNKVDIRTSNQKMYNEDDDCPKTNALKTVKDSDVKDESIKIEGDSEKRKQEKDETIKDSVNVEGDSENCKQEKDETIEGDNVIVECDSGKGKQEKDETIEKEKSLSGNTDHDLKKNLRNTTQRKTATLQEKKAELARKAVEDRKQVQLKTSYKKKLRK